ncbi:putative Smr domain-containing protein [Candidatus Termititenax spirochaetophilus]|uniref:Smr domain-containing protein n=1 Tax=Candidatus Termititenax spirochaetophilus TaxID=2218522 RepID=A0A388T9Q9_9BACT|nr:putative Smr domain-containing protein [Candidatus Termititenax spirochaetophilus]
MEEALVLVWQEILSARAKGYTALKIIHGCGAIREALPEFLAGRVRFCPGDKFEVFAPEGRDLVGLCPDLARDRDYNRHNAGVTLVLL